MATLVKGIKNEGIIEIDYIEFIEENLGTGIRTTRERQDYNEENKTLTTDEGGLYERNPWFIEGDKPRFLKNAIQQDGCLKIRVGDEPDFISHIWTKWIYCELNTRLYVKVRFRIQGQQQIGFQFGLDYAATDKPDPINSEAFVSHWYNSTNGFIEKTYPEDYDRDVTFGREHYGFYTNGKFFISKKMVDYKSATTVDLKTNHTNWESVKMTLINDRYEYETNVRLNNMQEYCFRLNNDENSYIPTLFKEEVKNPLIFFDEDTKLNFYKNGYNFYTSPIIPLQTKNPEKSIDLRLKMNTDDSLNLLIDSLHTIFRLNISDMNGRIVQNFNKTIPNKISLKEYSSGGYIVTAETSEGIFSQKFLK